MKYACSLIPSFYLRREHGQPTEVQAVMHMVGSARFGPWRNLPGATTLEELFDLLKQDYDDLLRQVIKELE